MDKLKQLKKKVYAEIDVIGSMSDVKLYNFVLRELNNDVNLATSFLLSLGGFTPGELKKIITTKSRSYRICLI